MIASLKNRIITGLGVGNPQPTAQPAHTSPMQPQPAQLVSPVVIANSGLTVLTKEVSEITNRFGGLTHPEAKKLIKQECQQLAGFLQSKGVSPDVIVRSIKSGNNNADVQDYWLKILEEYGVIPPTPKSQSPVATNVNEECSDVVPYLHRANAQPDILNHLCKTAVSVFLSGSSNSGKSTLARAMVWMFLQQRKDTQLFILEPQDEVWGGLEREEMQGVVRYISPDNEGVKVAAEVVRKAHAEMKRRYLHMQKCLRTGIKNEEHYHPVWVVVNEYNNLYEVWNELSQKDKAEIDVADWLPNLRVILRQGRKVGVRVMLIGQEHSSQSTGLSRSIMQSVTVASTGLILPDGNGGYGSVMSLINDQHLIKGAHQREALRKVYQAAVKERTPLLATTMGIPMIAELPDFSGAKTQNLAEKYKHKPLKLDVPQSPPVSLYGF